MSTKANETVVIIHETVIQCVLRDLVTVVGLVALIGIGVALDSRAMQWCGFILGMLALFTRVGRVPGIYRCKPQEAANILKEKFGVTAQ